MNKLEQKTENNKEARTEMSQLITYLLNEQKCKKSTSPEVYATATEENS